MINQRRKRIYMIRDNGSVIALAKSKNRAVQLVSYFKGVYRLKYHEDGNITMTSELIDEDFYKIIVED